MQPKITTFIGKIIGSRLNIKSNRWSTVYVYEPTIDRVHASRGNLYIILDLVSQYEELAQEIINAVREQYYHELDSDPLQSLESALSAANKKIESYSKKIITEKQETLQTINAACVVLVGQDLHLTQIGEVHSYLIRNGRLNKISNITPSSGTATQSFQNIASGKIEIGDIVTLSTPKLFDLLPTSEFKKITTSCYPSVAASRISEIITQKSNGGIAPSVLVLEVNADHQEETTSTAQPAREPDLQNQLKLEKDAIAQKIADQSDVLTPPAPPVQRLDQPLSKPAADTPAFQKPAEQSPAPPTPSPSPKKERGGLGIVSNYAKLIGKVVSGEEDFSKLSKLFLILGILLVSFVGFKILLDRGDSGGNPVVQTNQAFEQAWENYTQAREVLRNNDFVNAREYLLAAQAKAEEADSLGIFPEQTTSLLLDIQEELDKLDGVTRLTELNTIADILTLMPDAEPTQLELAANTFYIFDATNQSVFTLTKDTRQLQLVRDQIFPDKDAKLVTTTDDEVFFYAEAGDVPSMAEYDAATDTLSETAVVFDNSWKRATNIATWTDAGGTSRFYFTDPYDNAFWRFRESGAQYSVPENYFTSEESTPPLAQVADVNIDGNVYLLMDTGNVLKYVLNEPDEDFQLRGLKVGISNPVALDSVTPNGLSEEIGRRLYIADQGNARILVFGKEDGQLAKIYAANDAFDQLPDIVVDEVNNILYALDGTKIYQIQL